MSAIRTVLGREHPPRVGIVSAELARRRRPRYLELGVHTGVVFLHVRATLKVAVDPDPRIPRWKWLLHPNALLRGRLVRRPSDEYFAALSGSKRFDVIFVDGDHRFEQALRDVENSLEHLASAGVVLVHDCDPPSAAAASPDPADAVGGPWCGEVWKAIAHLRATRADLSVRVLPTDCGIGVIERRPSPVTGIDPDALPGMGWDELAGDRRRLLGIAEPPVRD